MKRLLMIAFHFPPMTGSSGIQRTLRFARYLPQFGWEPLILSASPRAYERRGDDQIEEPAVVQRAFALDAARHLAVRGRYPAWIARPDRWISWWIGAVPAGLTMIRRYRPQAIWSTFPIATAHKIGHTLHRLSGLPWIADFRDPMAQDGYPADPKTWKSFKRIEERALRQAAFSVFVTSGAARAYRTRYPDLPCERITVIENGYDEEVFERVSNRGGVAGPASAHTITLVHSGIVYPVERDPTQLFQALRTMLDAGRLTPGRLRLRLRASTYESLLGRLIGTYRLSDIVELAPPIPYEDALKEMLSASGLLVLQARNCNDQIPAKVYEYLRCRRPILALTDPSGETAALLRRAGMRSIAPLESAIEIARVLDRFLSQLERGEAELPDEQFVHAASRLHRTRELADLLERLPVLGAHAMHSASTA
jgi:glycosyltransferase involved in cell wall biosynthesis